MIIPKVPGNNDPAAVDIRKFLPDAYQGSVIITTRSSQVKFGRSMQVWKLADAHESVEILSSMSRRVLSVDDPNVTALVEKLDALPLALATTGSYLDQVTLHEDDPRLDTYEDRTLYSTWRMSLDRIQHRNELSARLFGLWCYFSNQDLWFELLRDGPTEELPWLCSVTADIQVFTEAMRLLCNYGLAHGEKTSRDSVKSAGYSIHACVHSWTIHFLNKEWDSALAKFVVCAAAQHFPGQESMKPWATQRRLLRHAERCTPYLQDVSSAEADVENALHNLGHLYSDQGKMKEAEEMYMQALKGCEEILGAEHTSTLRTVNNLGNLYYNQGKMKKTEEMYMRALKGYEEVWGPEHTSTLHAVNNMTRLYCKLVHQIRPPPV